MYRRSGSGANRQLPVSITGFTQPEGGVILYDGNGTYTFIPNENWSGETNFTYTISDGNGGSDTATVTVTINGADDVVAPPLIALAAGPAAAAETVSVLESTAPRRFSSKSASPTALLVRKPILMRLPTVTGW